MRTKVSATLALPAPARVFLQLAPARHQAGASNDEKITATLRAPPPQQMKGGGLPPIPSRFDRWPVDGVGNEQFESFYHFWNAVNPGGIRVHGLPLC
jgi:hypothetical protein